MAFVISVKSVVTLHEYTSLSSALGNQLKHKNVELCKSLTPWCNRCDVFRQTRHFSH